MTNQYCKLRKEIKGLFIFTFIVLLILQGKNNYVTILAKESQETEESSILREGKENVFQVNTICIDEEGKEHFVTSGTGFLIGDISKGQEQYLITTKTLVTVTTKTINRILSKEGLEKNSKIDVRYSVLVSENVIVNATIFNVAQDNDFAILALEKPLADRTGIPICKNSEEIKKGQEIFVIGFEKKLSQINIYSSHLNKVEDIEDQTYIVFKATLNGETAGAPILDSEGNVLGIYINIKGAEEVCYALSAKALREPLDTLGIEYISSDSRYGELKNTIENAQKILEKPEKYTERTTEVLNRIIENAKEVYKKENATNEEYQEQIENLIQAEKALQQKDEIYKKVIIILAVIAAIILAVVLIVLLIDKRNKNKLHFLGEDKQKKRNEFNQNKKEMLIDDFEKTVAISPKGSTAFLIHKATGERILITKELFAIGSQKDSTDLYIERNRYVGRKHAFIYIENGMFFIQDNNSINHTYVNGKQLQKDEKIVLRNKDLIQFANEEYQIEIKP